jgi:SAM-dependent methyltransferase
MTDSNLENIKTYFGEKLASYGATPRGADWNSAESQTIRFEQLAKVVDPPQGFSLIDYGCGYGALAGFLKARGYHFRYTGYDLLESMVLEGRQLFGDDPNCTFTSQERDLPTADYAVASGIFNIKFQSGDEDWTAYVLGILRRMHELSSKGFAFNMLTSYSDSDHMRPDLYYADPCFIFDYCKRHFARNVALLHDYGLYDFTILVRKNR